MDQKNRREIGQAREHPIHTHIRHVLAYLRYGVACIALSLLRGNTHAHEYNTRDMRRGVKPTTALIRRP